MKKEVKNKLSLLFFVVGVILLVLLVKKVGVHEILSYISQLGFKIIYLLLLPVTWYSIQSFAWWRVLADDGVEVSLWHVFLVKLTGEAINTATPFSFVGGDPYRIYLLQKKIDTARSVSSVVIDRTMYMLAVFLLLLTTFLVAWFYLPLPPAWRVFFPIFTFVFFLIFVFLVLFQRKGMFSTLTRLLKRLGIQKQRLEKISHKIEEVDEYVGRFYRKHKLHFFEIMLLQFMGKLMSVVEIYIIVSLLGFPVSFIQCFFIASLTVLINITFVFVPGSMGVMEGGYGALFYLLKLNPAYGVAIQLIRRIRQFFWIGIGLLIILIYRPKKVVSPVS